MIDKEVVQSQLLTLFRDRGFEIEAAQIQAKALLSEVAEQMPQYDWKYIARRVVRNLVAATFDLENISLEESDRVDEFSAAARKFALIWESLAQLQEATSRETALLNAAVNYELAGYQANAICIAKRLSSTNAELQDGALTHLSALFLQRRFIQLSNIVKTTLVQPGRSPAVDLQLIEAMATALSGSAFSQALAFFLSGNVNALERSMRSFKDAESLFASLDLVAESNLLRSIRSLLPVMYRRSTWTTIQGPEMGEPRWQRYLKLLARGVGSDVYKARSVSELWPSQLKALSEGLLNSSSNKLVRMPTSAGKTRIAELAIVHTLVSHPGAKCVYVAPYRALVSEVEKSFFGLLSDLGFRVSSVTGSFESDEFEEYLLWTTDVLVATPEKLDLVLRSHPEFLDNVQLFVLDEGHIVQDRERGIKFEVLLTRLKRRLSKARFIVLSAVVAQETLEDFAAWFNAAPQDIVTSIWRPSVQRYAKFEWRGQTGVIRYAPENDIPELQEFVPGVIRQQQYEFINPETGRRNRALFPDNTKAQAAAELAYKFAELGPVLVFCSQPRFVEAVAKAMQQKLRLLDLTGVTIPSHFNTPDTRTALLAKEWLGDSQVTSWFQSGIAVHFGNLPDSVRNAVEIDFRQREYRLLIATNTLGQGVNLPIRTVIVHSSSRYVNDRMERIPARDYWNIAGRAGRAGEETEGFIIHITLNQDDEIDYQYYLQHRENPEPFKGALYQRLLDLASNRLTEEAFKQELDPEILGILAEEGAEDLEHAAGLVLADSLIAVETTRAQWPFGFEKLTELSQSVAEDIARDIPDLELRSVYSTTGLNTTSCQLIHKHIIENEQAARSLFQERGLEARAELIDLLLPISLELSEIHPRREFGGSYTELLKRWVEGTNISDLVSEFGGQASSLEDLGRFIDDLFRYRLPWGVSGYIRIASKVLGFERSDLTQLVRSFPMMVKFGLPDPIACWAMSAGIPFRRTSMRIAAAYRDETDAIGYEDFLQWFGLLTSDVLHYEFGLTSPILEDVSRAVFTTGLNPLVRDFTELNEFLPRELQVRGTKYENRPLAALQAEVGQQVNLTRDYDNVMDRNALKVSVVGQDLGYVPRWEAQVLAPEIDTGIEVRAIVTDIKREDPPKVSIRIELAAA